MERLILKLVLLGDGRVGKTSIRRSYMGKSFITSHLMTLGADFAEEEIRFTSDDKMVTAKLQIWDIAGQDSFLPMRKRFLANASCVQLVYDITNLESFQNLSKWLHDVWAVNEDKNLPILVIGNKEDLHEERVVTEDMIKQFVVDTKKEIGNSTFIGYIETSALTGKNIKEGFKIITRAFFKDMKKNSN